LVPPLLGGGGGGGSGEEDGDTFEKLIYELLYHTKFSPESKHNSKPMEREYLVH
jgi:hypothetical protein